jgi:hypothetical protein
MLGRKGIVLFEGVKSIHDGIGHLDLWNAKETATVSGDLFSESTHVVSRFTAVQRTYDLPTAIDVGAVLCLA